MPLPRRPAIPQLLSIRLRRHSRILELCFQDGTEFSLSCELLRVYSPSAETAGHGPGQRRFPPGKSGVGISSVEPVGGYAVRLLFDDGHDTGLYTWEYLYELGCARERLERRYREALRAMKVEEPSQ